VVAVPRCRVWTYASDALPAVVLGCSQRRLRLDIEQRLAGRAELLERDSGGGAVLTGSWLVSASIVLPQGHPWVRDGLMESYRRLAQLHVAALSEIGVAARAMPPWEVPRADEAGATPVVDWACFGSLSAWEIVAAGGRKLVGLAQRRRTSGVLLVAGTLIGKTDWSVLCDVMGHPQDASRLRRHTTSGEEIAGSSIEPERFARVLMRSLTRALAICDEGVHPALRRTGL
jgi:lipoate-protein ligase A